MSADTEEYTPEHEGLAGISAIIAATITTILVLVHAYKVYSDLFTAERSVLNFRRSKPTITPGYKRMTYLTFSSIIAISGTLLIGMIEFNFVKACTKSVVVARSLDILFFFIGKCLFYLVLIYRLDDIYGTSAYGYSRKKLTCVGVTIILVCIFLYFFMTIFSVVKPIYYDDQDNKFPNFCQIMIGEPYVYISGALFFLLDFISSIAAMIAFIIPLNKVVKACNQYDSQKMNDAALKRLQKMMYTGYKYKVLVIMASCSTLIWIVLFMAGMGGLGTMWAHFDAVINPLCLILMTPYYPNDKWYERLCIVCICCCDPKRQSYHSDASGPHENVKTGSDTQGIDSTVVKSSVGPSLDTSMAIKTKLPATFDNNDANQLEVVIQEQKKDITPAPQEPTDENP
eukprot:314313_1